MRALVPARDPYIDNVKGVLILLVVIGHTIGQTLGVFAPGMAVYRWIYLFHMPAFVLVAGMMTSSTELGGGQVRGLLRAVALPYVVFQLGFTLLLYVNGRPASFGLDALLTPIYALWFLPALFWWRVSTPFFRVIRGALPIAVAISLAAPLSKVLGPALALDRTAGLLPFYVLGLVLGRGVLRNRPGRGLRIAAAGVLLAALPAAAVSAKVLPIGWLGWHATYRSLGVGAVAGMGLRLAFFAVVVSLIAAVFILVPRGATVFTGLGRWSMYPFLIHGAVTWEFSWIGAARLVTTPWAFALMLLAAAGLTFSLASPPVRRLFGPLVSPAADWLFAQPLPPRSRSAPARVAGLGHRGGGETRPPPLSVEEPVSPAARAAPGA